MGKTGENLHESSCFCTGDSRTFSTAKGGLFVFAALQPADRQARMGMAANVRERALDDIADSHIRKGRSPEKPQIFLYLYHADYAYYNRRCHKWSIVDGTHPWQLCRSCDYIAQG